MDPKRRKPSWGPFFAGRSISEALRTTRVLALRLSRNTACSPNKFQNHHGTFSRIGAPQALSATERSILAPTTSQSSRKSLMVQKWMLGDSHQA